MAAHERGASAVLRKPFGVAALERCIASLQATRSQISVEHDFRTSDPTLACMLERLTRVANTEATIRIRGGSGVGKKKLARWIHARSPRRLRPFVVANFAGLSERDAEEDLFGVSAPSGPRGRIGAAQGGSLVLDAIHEMPWKLQGRLLQLLQHSDVGRTPEVRSRLDLRILVTSQCDLEAEVAAGRFREDLFLRLNVVAESLSLLCERPDDIVYLGQRFLADFSRARGGSAPIWTEALSQRLLSHPFRGNVRELRNIMQRASILFPDREVDFDELLGASARRGAMPKPSAPLNLRALERDAIERSLAWAGGNRTMASEALGISARTLRNKIRQYDLA